MKALLDTHTFLWWNMDDGRLSEIARTLISDGRNEIFFSAASAWEIALKHEKGRIQLPEAPWKYISTRLSLHQFQPLAIQISHAVHTSQLPPHHGDPFDRLLIATAQLENMPILTADEKIARYDVEVIW